MCKYCKDGVAIVDDKNLGLAIYWTSHGKDNAYVRGYDKQGWDVSTTFKMYYCPMCGEKISD